MIKKVLFHTFKDGTEKLEKLRMALHSKNISVVTIFFQDSVFCNTTQWALHHIKYDTYMNNDPYYWIMVLHVKIVLRGVVSIEWIIIVSTSSWNTVD